MKAKSTILILEEPSEKSGAIRECLKPHYHLKCVTDADEFLGCLRQDSDHISLALINLDNPFPRNDESEVDTLPSVGVLKRMKDERLLDDIPVLMVVEKNDIDLLIKAYDLGVFDCLDPERISTVVPKRVSNALLLKGKEKELERIAYKKLFEKNKTEKLMTAILSHIVEFRNGESGRHVININIITRIVLKWFAEHNPKYKFTDEEIGIIANASTLHDIGKILIPDPILNKPGRYTPEEFAVMKKHPLYGADLLRGLPVSADEPLIKYAYEICRWHHERYDGRGYPDGLKGDEIPISAQVVALADVYDALTSERCYKKAFSHEKAISMILNGECGAFNPELMECLKAISDELVKELKDEKAFKAFFEPNSSLIMESAILSRESVEDQNTENLILFEKEKLKFLTETPECFFTFFGKSFQVSFNAEAQKELGVPAKIIEKDIESRLRAYFSSETLDQFAAIVRKPKDAGTDFSFDGELSSAKDCQRISVTCRKIWGTEKEEAAAIVGVIRKLAPVLNSRKPSVMGVT